MKKEDAAFAAMSQDDYTKGLTKYEWTVVMILQGLPAGGAADDRAKKAIAQADTLFKMLKDK